MSLVYKNEKNLTTIAVIISGIIWLTALFASFGILLIYILFGYLFFLFAHSVFISHLQGSAVKIGQEQYPDLYDGLVRACGKIGLKEIPEAYLLRTDYFNALATRFLGRNFVVLFTDVVDALEAHPDAINFYIGHELGHIHRKHLSWMVFLAPASILPLLGAALKRAKEYTCDRYGVAACNSEESIKFAIAAIAAGNSRWKHINLDAYLAQIKMTSGFWMSFNELTSDYPWLTKRMATALAVSRGEEIQHPDRHWFAWILAAFSPRIGGGTGGVASMMLLVLILGILAAVALPAYQDYTSKALVKVAYSEAISVKAKVAEYVASNQELPTSMAQLGYASEEIVDMQGRYEILLDETATITAKVHLKKLDDDHYLMITPTLDEGNLSWTCESAGLSAKVVPADCR